MVDIKKDDDLARHSPTLAHPRRPSPPRLTSLPLYPRHPRLHSPFSRLPSDRERVNHCASVTFGNLRAQLSTLVNGSMSHQQEIFPIQTMN